ncbi:RNA-directed DNA polymerase from mobile element jockey-like [Elysia marginata]|uniref:RNA-directed DNA polymerase from mobile element jockey-like n=1 Tax=Elysia marginata TaxID=1093978 RepID=A0AAV4H8U9_9GAST|nr:RNA-directed DNA polymerase from mobile element jockey-like [Elysia marginata]
MKVNALLIFINKISQKVYSKSSSSKYFHDQIEDVVGRKPSPKSGCIKLQSGQFLMDISDILKRWSQYVEELFDDVRGPRPPIRNNEGPPIMEEVKNAIRKMNHNKAAGPDEIPIELFDALNETCLVHFTELLNFIRFEKNQYS